MPIRIRATPAVAIAAVCGAVALAGVDLQPRVVALTGATVAVGNDRVLAGATILVRDGLIAAVGRTSRCRRTPSASISPASSSTRD